MTRKRIKDLRRRAYQVLEQGPIGDRTSKAVDRFLVLLILVNLIAVALESIPRYEAEYGGIFAAIEAPSDAILISPPGCGKRDCTAVT